MQYNNFQNFLFFKVNSWAGSRGLSAHMGRIKAKEIWFEDFTS